jgi:hypothetical protein
MFYNEGECRTLRHKGECRTLRHAAGPRSSSRRAGRTKAASTCLDSDHTRLLEQACHREADTRRDGRFALRRGVQSRAALLVEQRPSRQRSDVLGLVVPHQNLRFGVRPSLVARTCMRSARAPPNRVSAGQASTNQIGHACTHATCAARTTSFGRVDEIPRLCPSFNRDLERGVVLWFPLVYHGLAQLVAMVTPRIPASSYSIA